MSITAGSGVEVAAIDTPALGDRSYLVHDGDVAVVVDPQRDIDRVLALAEHGRVRITHVFETHVHNDYVTGGLVLALATGAGTTSRGRPVAFDRVPAADGDAIEVSPGMRVRVLHPGPHVHPPVLRAGGRRPGTRGVHRRFAALRLDRTARPARPRPRRRAGPRAVASARRLAAELPEDADVYPTHGFGCFCSATQTEGNSSTIGRERRLNPALTLDEDGYVAELLAGLDAYPAYYAHMGPANAAGPAARPVAAGPGGRRRAEAAHRGRRVGRGPAGPPGLRRRAPAPALSASTSTAASPPTWAG